LGALHRDNEHALSPVVINRVLKFVPQQDSILNANRREITRPDAKECAALFRPFSLTQYPEQAILSRRLP
jgi:hypothetical protein